MISGRSQCPSISGRDLQCCISEKYIRAAAVEDSNLQALGPVSEEVSLPLLDNPNLVGFENGGQGDLIPFPSAEQDPKDLMTGGDKFESIALLPSDGLLDDSGNVAFSLPEGVNSDGSTSGAIEYPENIATLSAPGLSVFSPGSEEEVETGTGAISFLPPQDGQPNAGGDFEQFWGR
jgi:hypothetical protein